MNVRDRFALDGKVSVVTGASRNIGREIAVGLAEAGSDVVLVARDLGRLAEVADSIRRRTGRRVEAIGADVGIGDDVERLVEEVAGRFPAVHVLVNNAAYYAHRDDGSGFGIPLDDLTEGDWARALGVNLLGPFLLSQRLAPRMRQVGGGCILNVLSGGGFTPYPSYAAYGCSKAALWMLTRYQSVEWAPDIRVNAICPGVVIDHAAQPSAASTQVAELAPMGRAGRPDEVAGAAVYLASGAASYVTGTVVHVNGGRPL